MKYHRIKCEIYKAEGKTWERMAEELLLSAVRRERVVRLIFFTACKDNQEYRQQRTFLEQWADSHFPSPRPVVSVVAQKPLEGELVLEVHSLPLSVDEAVTLEERFASSVRYLRITSADYREIIAGGLCADDLNLPIQCYQDFNDVRSQFYATSEWQSGYPAATGIGAQHGGIQIDFNAVSGKIGIIPLDNDWQRAAHVYSDEVLISHRPDTEKGTPKFERGKSLSDHQQEVIYISGTAAIRGEESMVTGDVLWQTEITLENIQHLIGLEEGKEKLPEHSGKLELLRVYLKNEKDAQIVKEDMDKLCPGVPVAYLYADVCREELLVEIEGIAHL